MAVGEPLGIMAELAMATDAGGGDDSLLERSVWLVAHRH